MPDNFADKVADLNERLRRLGSVVVAFSGGLDSAVLLSAAVRALGRAHVLAVTGRSPSLPRAELEAVAALAAECGAAHEFVDTGEFANPEYLANSTTRCYLCRQELYGRLTQLAAARGFQAVAGGANADDQHDFRPGLAAAREFGVHAPLAEAGLSKAELRRLAAEFGLSIRDKPASPCLASRVPYGEPITIEKLGCIDAAETFLRELGFRECRVRHHGRLARIEVPATEIQRLAADGVRVRVLAHLQELGYQYVTLDLRGFRSGSLNEVLPDTQVGGRRRPAGN
jgi:uncharacterized protein